MVDLGEPLAETIRSVTIGHQFPFTGELALLSVRPSFAVFEMSVEFEGFCSIFSRQGRLNRLSQFKLLLGVLYSLFGKCNNADLSQVRVHCSVLGRNDAEFRDFKQISGPSIQLSPAQARPVCAPKLHSGSSSQFIRMYRIAPQKISFNAESADATGCTGNRAIPDAWQSPEEPVPRPQRVTVPHGAGG